MSFVRYPNSSYRHSNNTNGQIQKLQDDLEQIEENLEHQQSLWKLKKKILISLIKSVEELKNLKQSSHYSNSADIDDTKKQIQKMQDRLEEIEGNVKHLQSKKDAQINLIKSDKRIKNLRRQRANIDKQIQEEAKTKANLKRKLEQLQGVDKTQINGASRSKRKKETNTRTVTRPTKK